MRVDQAKEIARQWLEENGPEIPGIEGAFIHGSGASLPDDADLPPISDLDLMVVIDGPIPAVKLGKFRYRDLLLEVSYLASGDVASANQVLGQYHMAGSFRYDGILYDRDGRLTKIQRGVAKDFAKEKWVRRRCEHAADRVLNGFPHNPEDPIPDQINSWLFPNGVLTHVLLVAGLKNPTVRTRYLAARELLKEYGFSDFYPLLLMSLGVEYFRKDDAKHLLWSVTEQFDAAMKVVRPDYPFAADISPDGRVVAIDGSNAMIRQGDYKEAIFWLAATANRCQQVFLRSGDLDLQHRFTLPYQNMLIQLGLPSPGDLHIAIIETNALLPLVQAVADAIIEANPDIHR